ncbi:uncharacterized protein LOC141915163 [Tubulanus polymorphus]|uniref:uncharacterized protein LOC141915163 n=1 Tax=Tubulanus polymorphus TaxID=672921 RepID=UPI003DA5ACD7
MTSFLAFDAVDDLVVKAEAVFCGYLAVHNIPIAASDHFGELLRMMLPLDNPTLLPQVIKKFSCGKTMATYILRELAQHTQASLVEQMGPFSLSTDVGHERGKKGKLDPIVITLVSNENCVKTELLAMLDCEGHSNGENITKMILGALDTKGTSMNNCMALCTDNVNVMILHKVPKHVATRWLSLEQTAIFVLEHWHALGEFFKKEIESDKNSISSKQILRNPVPIERRKLMTRRRNFYEFFQNVVKYLQAACSYIIKKFLLNDPLLKNAEVADVRKQCVAKFSGIRYFDTIKKEFTLYLVEDLPEKILSENRGDIGWQMIGNLIDDITGSLKYKNLSRLMLAIMCIPHSNATSERVFSLVRKNKTDFRSCMSVLTPCIKARGYNMPQEEIFQRFVKAMQVCY